MTAGLLIAIDISYKLLQTSTILSCFIGHMDTGTGGWEI